MIMAHKLVCSSSLALSITAMWMWCTLPLMSSAAAQETTQPASPVQPNGGVPGSGAVPAATTAASSTTASKKIPLAAPFTVPPEEYLPAAEVTSALPIPATEDYAGTVGAGFGGQAVPGGGFGGGPGGFGPNGFGIGYGGPLFFNSAPAAAPPSSGFVAAVVATVLMQMPLMAA